MKTKKLLKRIINARMSGKKKESKKVRKHNNRFFDDLLDETMEIDARDALFNNHAVVLTDTASKAQIFKYVKDVIASGDTELNETAANAQPIKKFEVGVFTFEFNGDVNPYRVIASNDLNMDELKSLTISVLKAVQPVPEAVQDEPAE